MLNSCVYFFVLFAISAVELKSAVGSDNKYCVELSRAVEDFCSYDIVQRECPRTCKDGISPNLRCGKNLHSRKFKNLRTDVSQLVLKYIMYISGKKNGRALLKALKKTSSWFKQFLTQGTKEEMKVSKQPDSSATQGTKRVVYGKKSEQGEWPWHAKLRNYPNDSTPYPGRNWCEATILTENFVLTAAHCFQEYLAFVIGHKNYTAKHLKVVVGDYDSKKREEFETEIQVAELYHNPSYKQENHLKSYYNGMWSTIIHDITLVKLSTPIKLEDKNKEQVCIPKSDEHEKWKNAVCFSYGRGYTENSTSSRYLKEVQLPLVPLETCNEPRAYNNTVTDQNICAGFFNRGKTTCNDDAGASLVCKKMGEDPRWYQLGIVSSGKYWDMNKKTPSGSFEHIPCNQYTGDYGLYTNVVKNIDWILKTVFESE